VRLAAARASGASSAEIVKVLGQLAAMPVTAKALKKSGLGLEVNHRTFRRHACPAVREQSTRLVQAWRRLPEFEKARSADARGAVLSSTSQENLMAPAPDVKKSRTKATNVKEMLGKTSATKKAANIKELLVKRSTPQAASKTVAKAQAQIAAAKNLAGACSDKDGLAGEIERSQSKTSTMKKALRQIAAKKNADAGIRKKAVAEETRQDGSQATDGKELPTNRMAAQDTAQAARKNAAAAALDAFAKGAAMAAESLLTSPSKRQRTDATAAGIGMRNFTQMTQSADSGVAIGRVSSQISPREYLLGVTSARDAEVAVPMSPPLTSSAPTSRLPMSPHLTSSAPPSRRSLSSTTSGSLTSPVKQSSSSSASTQVQQALAQRQKLLMDRKTVIDRIFAEPAPSMPAPINENPSGRGGGGGGGGKGWFCYAYLHSGGCDRNPCPYAHVSRLR